MRILGIRNKDPFRIYTDELNDDFSDLPEVDRIVGDDYEFKLKGLWTRFVGLILYWVVGNPVAWVYMKLFFWLTTKNRKVLKQAKNTGYFVYGNHTQPVGDAFNPMCLAFPKKAFVIVNPKLVFAGPMRYAIVHMGGLPLPGTPKAVRNFNAEIKRVIDKKKVVFIYPEAHVWPYYTKIRPFGDSSFRYPVKYKVPCYCTTNVYTKRLGGRIAPKMTTYVDGPFYPDESLDLNAQKTDLRDRIYKCMLERSKLSNYEHIEYIKKDK